MMREPSVPPTGGEVLVYRTEDGTIRLDVRLEDETVWLTQQMMAELFQTSKQNIGQHIANILQEGELQEDGTVKKFFTVRLEGERQVKRSVIFYNLDMIISVGYRVKWSPSQGPKFPPGQSKSKVVL